jgi:hypothetical protein
VGPEEPPAPEDDDPLAVPIALHRALLPGTRELNRFERSDPAGEPASAAAQPSSALPISLR